MWRTKHQPHDLIVQTSSLEHSGTFSFLCVWQETLAHCCDFFRKRFLLRHICRSCYHLLLVLCFLCASSPKLPPAPPPPNPNQGESWRGGCRGGRRTALSGWSQGVGPVAFSAKWCAFLLQLSEGLNQRKRQLCSNILIIYCSAALITVHHHLERLTRTEGEFSLSVLNVILFSLIFPAPSHVTSHGLGCVGKEEGRGGGGGEGQAPLLLGVGMWALEMWSSLSECHYWVAFLFVFLNHRWIIWTPWNFKVWLQFLLNHLLCLPWCCWFSLSGHS